MERRFELRSPGISPALARHTGLSPKLRVIAETADKRQVAIDQNRRIPMASNALFHGWLVPGRAEVEPVDPAELQPVVAKLAGDEYLDDYLAVEEKLLDHLRPVDGVPKILAAGATPVHYENCRWRETDRLAPYLVLSFSPGKDLFKYQLADWQQKQPSRAEISRLSTGILPALAERLAAVHEREVVHRDVKPNNALFDEESGQVTLVDFGIANRLFAEPRHEVGVFGYYPPEVRLGRPTAEDRRADVYGFGVTAFVLLSGEAGLLYRGMENIWSYTGLELFIFGQDRIKDEYYEMLLAQAGKNPAELARSSNLPGALKETHLGNYLFRLAHPDINQRPSDLRAVADELRRLGGELDSYTLNGPGQ